MPWIELSEAALTLGVSERTVRNWIRSGKLPKRSVCGIQEVELPDSDEFKRLTEPGNGKNESPLTQQQRLHTALVECGRLKGMLGSQEKVVESLSATVAETEARLERSRQIIARRTILCVVIAFLGVMAYALSKLAQQERYGEMQQTFSARLDDAREKHEARFLAKVESIQKTSSDERARLEARYRTQVQELKESLASVEPTASSKDLETALAAQEARLQQEFQKELRQYRRMIDRVQAEKQQIESELRRLHQTNRDDDAQSRTIATLRRELEQARLRAATHEAEAKKLQTANAELEETIRSLRKRLAGLAEIEN